MNYAPPLSNKLTERLRKLEAFAARPGTPGEGIAAEAALERIKARLSPNPMPHRHCRWCGGDNFISGGCCHGRRWRKAGRSGRRGHVA